jgi:translation initiation factor 2B subunit (eIF-2B alpha/beta/delta family)
MGRVDDQYQTLLRDNSSGSSDLFKQTIHWIDSALKEGQDPTSLLRELQQLCKTHPSMALLRNFSKLFEKIPLNEKRIRAWVDMYTKHEETACKKLRAHLSNFSNLLVHSYSGMLYKSLSAVTSPLSIFCTESRPAFEGRMLAEKLSETNHKVFLISDMAAFSTISRVEALLFGCDAITPRGIVNKIGTAPLAEIGQRQGKMNYFIGTSEKLLEQWDDDILLRQGSSNEIYNGDRMMQVENYYFDLTSPSFISGLFLETGISRMFE